MEVWMPISRVEAWTVRLPLSRPVTFGAVRFSERDYAVVRLTDDDGVEGFGYGLARGAPIAATVQALAPRIVGADASLVERVWLELYESLVTQGQNGAAARALSLVDIAMWDLRARRAKLPLYRMLGGWRDTVMASVGGGYFREMRPREEIREELSEYVRRGFQHIKVPAGGLTPAEEEAWLADVRGAIGSNVALAVDAHWSWRDVVSARRVLERLDQFSLDWVEDPLWPEHLAAARELRRHVKTPIAIGDEQSGRWFFHNLAEAHAADIWRVDVTTVGGFTEFRRVAALASVWGVPISTHIYPEIHIHCAASDPTVIGVEYTDPEADIDLSHTFVSEPLVPRNGVVTAPTAPGLGFDLDWELIRGTAREAATL
jgi:L-alanine-DL-glutamate epimerase-like enolase superfamily enzyme